MEVLNVFEEGFRFRHVEPPIICTPLLLFERFYRVVSPLRFGIGSQEVIFLRK